VELIPAVATWFERGTKLRVATAPAETRMGLLGSHLSARLAAAQLAAVAAH